MFITNYFTIHILHQISNKIYNDFTLNFNLYCIFSILNIDIHLAPILEFQKKKDTSIIYRFNCNKKLQMKNSKK